MVVMIIKGIFRRYERWNPVHPTYGAFWGMGFGIGCGVGWGPGFGPDVIGYVGAGCGVGFSVGITLAGVGIGLPANMLLAAPLNAALAARRGASELLLGSNGLLFSKHLGGDDWKEIYPDLQRDLGRKFSNFHPKNFSYKQVNLDYMKKWPVGISKELGRFGNRLFCACKGTHDRHRGDTPDM